MNYYRGGLVVEFQGNIELSRLVAVANVAFGIGDNIVAAFEERPHNLLLRSKWCSLKSAEGKKD